MRWKSLRDFLDLNRSPVVIPGLENACRRQSAILTRSKELWYNNMG